MNGGWRGIGEVELRVKVGKGGGLGVRVGVQQTTCPHSLLVTFFSPATPAVPPPSLTLQHSSLEELYMSRLPLTGPLPDSIPEDSNLIVWYGINRDPITNKPAGEGFSGKLPRSLANAKRLAFVELSGHRLSGDVPVLPPSIRMFEVHNNMLDGSVECE